jgi:RNA recognition motif-containing protein
VGNLSPTVDEYTLLQVFSKFGKIAKLDLMFHKTGVLKGKPRGYAFVEFVDKDVSDHIKSKR